MKITTTGARTWKREALRHTKHWRIRISETVQRFAVTFPPHRTGFPSDEERCEPTKRRLKFFTSTRIAVFSATDLSFSKSFLANQVSRLQPGGGESGNCSLKFSTPKISAGCALSGIITLQKVFKRETAKT